MNNDLEQFSEERLQRYINQFAEDGMCDITDDEIMPLIRIALAAKQAKPVAYIADCGTIISDGDRFFDDYKNPQPLYTTPQPAHTEQVIPDGLTEIQLIKAMTWINRVRADSPNMKEARTCADLILRFLPAAPKPESE